MKPWAEQVFAHPGEDHARQATIDAVTARLAGHSLWTMSLHDLNGDELTVPGYRRADLGDTMPSATFSTSVSFGRLDANCTVGGAMIHGPGDIRIKVPFSHQTHVVSGANLTVNIGQ